MGVDNVIYGDVDCLNILIFIHPLKMTKYSIIGTLYLYIYTENPYCHLIIMPVIYIYIYIYDPRRSQRRKCGS